MLSLDLQGGGKKKKRVELSELILCVSFPKLEVLDLQTHKQILYLSILRSPKSCRLETFSAVMFCSTEGCCCRNAKVKGCSWEPTSLRSVNLTLAHLTSKSLSQTNFKYDFRFQNELSWVFNVQIWVLQELLHGIQDLWRRCRWLRRRLHLQLRRCPPQRLRLLKQTPKNSVHSVRNRSLCCSLSSICRMIS